MRISVFFLIAASSLVLTSGALAGDPAFRPNLSGVNANGTPTGRSAGDGAPGVLGTGTKVNPYSGVPVGQPLQPNDLGYAPSKPEPDGR